MGIYQKIVHIIDGTPMYRVVSVSLGFLAVCSLLASVSGLLRYSFTDITFSLAVALTVAVVVNGVCARLWDIHTNTESAIITALIVFFIVVPGSTVSVDIFSSLPAWGIAGELVYSYLLIALVTVVAIISKFILAYRGQHILNPAAVGVVAFSLTGVHEFTWWIGTPELFIPLLIAGVLVVHKIRKWEMVGAFLLVGFAVFMFDEWRYQQDMASSAMLFFTSYSSLFLAFYMLTEPFTTPPTKRTQIVYGALVGFVAHTTLFYPYVVMSPELALVVGNLVLYPTTLRQKLQLSFIKKVPIARDTYDFIFKKPAGLQFVPGQYLEWMLPHADPDQRGLRRYFTIASAPSESVVRLGVKILPEEGSSFKRALWHLTPGDSLTASQRAGDFTLPRVATQKLALVAGGIGVTPYRSFIAHMLNTKEYHDTVLYYCANERADIAYQEAFQEAAATFNFRFISVLAHEESQHENELSGFLDAEKIAAHTPDYRDRLWYLSGPPPMVQAYDKVLRAMGVPAKQIKKDFFPGLA